ncbi:hypothetical protein NDU88_005125 [Pleurodeles waltl]|uniref:Uncharacterized protein n=1 Tax=Pleurodeles waltl TaxID=8319 RepID=A0AAV7L8K5_PLEWA|nr:hypothetical protein NDU88_005125 [Pleurodeles waltl]
MNGREGRGCRAESARPTDARGSSRTPAQPPRETSALTPARRQPREPRLPVPAPGPRRRGHGATIFRAGAALEVEGQAPEHGGPCPCITITAATA